MPQVFLIGQDLGRGKRCRQGAGAVVVQELTETMGPGFEYSHLQFYENNIIWNEYEDKEEKETGNVHFRKVVEYVYWDLKPENKEDFSQPADLLKLHLGTCLK